MPRWARLNSGCFALALPLVLPLTLFLTFPVSARAAQSTVPAGSTTALVTGSTLDLACADLSVLGTVRVNGGRIANTGTLGIAQGGTVDGGSGNIFVGNGWTNNGSFLPGTSTVTLGDGCASGPFSFSGGPTVFNNLTLSSNNGRSFVIPSGLNIMVTGTLTLQGAPGKPIQVVSANGGNAYIGLGPNATVVQSNASVATNVLMGNDALAVPGPGGPALGLLALVLAGLAARMGRLPAPGTRRRLQSGLQSFIHLPTTP